MRGGKGKSRGRKEEGGKGKSGWGRLVGGEERGRVEGSEWEETKKEWRMRESGLSLVSSYCYWANPRRYRYMKRSLGTDG